MFSNLTPVVKNLLLLNVVMYVLSLVAFLAAQINLTDYLGLYYFESPNFEPYQYVSHMFMHAFVGPDGGIVFFHILFNMLALFMFGRSLEMVWGPRRFFLYYVVTGLGAAFLHTFVNWLEIRQIQMDLATLHNNMNPETFQLFINHHFPQYSKGLMEFIMRWSDDPASAEAISVARSYAEEMYDVKVNIPTVGASGAVFGVLLAFGMIFPNTQLMLLIPPMPIKAKYMVIIYGAIELYLGVSASPDDNVAHFAHLGGMIFGFILIKYWNKSITRYN